MKRDSGHDGTDVAARFWPRETQYRIKAFCEDFVPPPWSGGETPPLQASAP
jgi:hypothetical protein